MSIRSLEPGADPIGQAAGWCLLLSQRALTREEQSAFDDWLQADLEHREALDHAVRAWRAAEQAATTPEVINMRTAALTAFREGQRRRWRPRLGRSRLGARLAAAMVVAAAVGVAAWLALAPQVYQTGIGERRVVALSDGSKISMDAATRVSVRYRSHRRDIRLEEGRANFVVAKDSARPFTVSARDNRVLATGTAFTVELLPGQLRVILYEGRVRVTGPPADRRAAPGSAQTPIRADGALTPGRELIVSASQPVATVAAVDPVRTLSWEGGQLDFVDEPLSSVVERMNRYSDEKLAVGDPGAAAVRVSGVFTAGDTAAFMEGLVGVFPVQVRDGGAYKVIVSRAG